MSVYGDLNYYGNLPKAEGFHVYYSHGCRLDNMTGILMIDTGEEIWTNKGLQEGIEIETRMFRLFTDKVLEQCMRGEICEKVSREIG